LPAFAALTWSAGDSLPQTLFTRGPQFTSRFFKFRQGGPYERLKSRSGKRKRAQENRENRGQSRSHDFLLFFLTTLDKTVMFFHWKKGNGGRR
jgi:hypothetical protein